MDCTTSGSEATVVADVGRKEQDRNERGADEQNQAVDEKGPEVKSTGDGRWRKDGDKLCGSGEDVSPTKLISDFKKRDANHKPKKGAKVLCCLKGVQKRATRGGDKKEPHVTGPAIQKKKIGQVKMTADARRIEAQTAREEGNWTAERAAVVADVRRKELERNQRAAGEQNPEVWNTAAALRRRDKTATKYRGVGFLTTHKAIDRWIDG